jgi:hypothetical protein
MAINKATETEQSKPVNERVACALGLATPLKPSSLHYLVEKPSFASDSAAWSQLLEFSERNGTSAQVARSALGSDWVSAIPESVRTTLQEKVNKDDEQRKKVEAEMDFSIQVLLKSEISFAVIKGLDLARRFYPQIHDRTVESVNLFVPPSGKLSALQALIKAGYGTLDLPNQTHYTTLSRSPRGVKLHLYFALSSLDSSTAAGEAWNRTQEDVIPGLPPQVRALCREDQIALLITEASSWGRPSSPVLLNDLHCLIQGEKIDWDELIWLLADKRALFAGWFVFSTLYKEYLTDVSEKALLSLANSINPSKRKSVEKTQLETELSEANLKWNDGLMDRVRFGVQHGVNPFSVHRSR